MATVGAHLSHFVQNETHAVLGWISSAAQWFGAARLGEALERADQGFSLADTLASAFGFGEAVKKTVDIKEWKVSDWTSIGRVVSSGSGLVVDIAASIDFLSYVKAIVVDSGVLSQVSVIGNVASLTKNVYKLANEVQKIAQFALKPGHINELKWIRQSTKLVRTVMRAVGAILGIGALLGAFAVSTTALLVIASVGLVFGTVGYLLKREICRLELLAE